MRRPGIVTIGSTSRLPLPLNHAALARGNQAAVKGGKDSSVGYRRGNGEGPVGGR
jgi:hypothetical protein